GYESRVLEEDQHRRGARGAERREVRPDHPPAVGGYEGWIHGRQRSAGATALTPGLEQKEESGGRFTDEGVGVGALIAENLGGGLVDEPDTVLGVEDQDTLAQVLDDVLRE